ncbi:MAG: extracellular solute-binding protein [Chloroflexi bacterium]|nr:extracellular solute-binding protein [Chloroflexota bacterium]
MDRLQLQQRLFTRRRMLAEGAAILASLSMLSLLTACGNSTVSTATTPSSTTASSTQAPGASSSAAVKAPVSSVAQPEAATRQVTWLVPEDPLLDKFAEEGIVPAFQKTHPALRVQVITPGSTAYGEKLLALVAAGAVPEVFATWSGSSFFEL